MKISFDLHEVVLETYLNSYLNVDYRTIDVDTFMNDLNRYVLWDFKREYIEEYVEYVKENQIVITADANIVKPCYYFDGGRDRIRVNIDMDIESSLTNLNILFQDIYRPYPIEYSQKDMNFYMDIDLIYYPEAHIKYAGDTYLYYYIIQPEKSGIKMLKND